MTDLQIIGTNEDRTKLTILINGKMHRATFLVLSELLTDIKQKQELLDYCKKKGVKIM